ncbi:YeiH family protein [Chelatococcus reniformis]|uniref:Membrane protein n=1 Tax=Chelatococcus reniformis TaxID=1494448 RepID=A0A916URZ1_9HYPH|nr:YeiH family protein [Chelatococcus reniformis]GGC84009.1 membrane protein [Chelatococcus reniformis]
MATTTAAPAPPGGTGIAAPPYAGGAFAITPGLLLTGAIAGVAFALRELPGVATFSPLILAILIGTALNNLVGTPARAGAGVAFSLRRVLRCAIVLLGLQLTAEQVAAVGAGGVAVIALTLAATFVFTVTLGRRIGVDRGLAELIAAGTSICGASAVIATNTVTRASDEDVAYAIACVTVFGSIAMFTYPLLPGLLHLDAHSYGLWSGASIHEIAQVVAAAFQDGKEAGEFGTVAKLTRVMMLAPVVIALGLLAARRARGESRHDGRGKAPMPWFVLGFIALVAVNSIIAVPPEVRAAIATGTTFLLAMALAAMGLETNIGKLKAKGARPLALAAASFAFIATFSLTLVKLIG